MIYLYIILLLIVCRFSQIFFSKRIINYFKDGPTGDASTYFFLIQFFRYNSCGVSDERCLLSNKPVLVPSLYMKLVAKIFPDKVLFKYSWLPNYCFYIVGVFFFIFISRGLIKEDYLGLLIISILFVTQCDNSNFDNHKIHYLSLQPRYLGLIVNSTFWAIYIIYDSNSILLFGILTAMLIIALNVSVFSRQTVALSIFVFSIFSFSYILILLFAIAFILSMILFKKEFIPSIKPQLEYSYQYFKSYYKPRKDNNVLINYVKNTFARALVFDSYLYFPFFILTILITLVKINWISTYITINENIIDKLFFYCITITFIFLLTGFRKFAFIGECWRYISFTNYFISPIFLYLIIDGLPITENFKLILITLIIVLNISLIFLDRKKRAIANENKILSDLLNKYKSELTNAIWYGIPYRVSTFAVSIGLGKSTFEYQYGNHSLEIHEKYFSKYPYLKWNKEILSQNKVTHILVQKSLQKEAEEISGFMTNDLNLIEENDTFSLYRRNFLTGNNE